VKNCDIIVEWWQGTYSIKKCCAFSKGWSSGLWLSVNENLYFMNTEKEKSMLWDVTHDNVKIIAVAVVITMHFLTREDRFGSMP
jgi:hypothetical protein